MKANLLFLPVLFACAHDPSQPTGQLQIYETCLETECDQLVGDGNAACSACLDACANAAYDCDPTTACEESCSTRQCDEGEQSQCLEQGYKVTFADNPDPAIYRACEGMLSAFSSCGDTTQLGDSDCTRYSTVDPDSDVAIFDCIAQLDCGSVTSSSAIAGCYPPPSTWGDAFCSQLAQQCPSSACSSDTQAALDMDGATTRQDALDAAMTCLSQPSCDETTQCLSAWRAAVE